jgi:hypothetical protein
VRLHFPASNNMAEYEALLCGLKIAIETVIKRLDIRGDSQLVIDQVMKNASCHDDKMEAYCNAVRALEDKFYSISLTTCPAGTTRRRMSLPKSRRGESLFPQMFLCGMSPDRPSTSSRPLEPGGTLGGSLRPKRREAYGRGPLERGVCTLPARGVWHRRGRGHGYIAGPPRGGLARQIHCLKGPTRASPGPIRGQTHHQDGQVIRPHRWRAVQARRVRRPAMMYAHPSGAQAPSRNSRERVRPPCSTTHPRGQRVPSGLLLVHGGR